MANVHKTALQIPIYKITNAIHAMQIVYNAMVLLLHHAHNALLDFNYKKMFVLYAYLLLIQVNVLLIVLN